VPALNIVRNELGGALHNPHWNEQTPPVPIPDPPLTEHRHLPDVCAFVSSPPAQDPLRLEVRVHTHDHRPCAAESRDRETDRQTDRRMSVAVVAIIIIGLLTLLVWGRHLH
jgi:hypothetical protein